MPVTIKDIARQANVSHSTVSRALHGSPLISEDTADRIRQTALELGYLPSAAARTLKTNRSQALGVIIRSVDDPFFGEILQGIEEVAQTNCYSLFMAASRPHMVPESDIVQSMVERRVDGIIICSTPVSTSQSDQLARFGVPIVVINNQAAEEYRYSIYHDDVDGSRQITRHLIELGHRKIAYLGNVTSGRSTIERIAGFKKEMGSAGLPIPPEYIHQVSGGSAIDGLNGLGYFLQLPERPTALICYNDMMAIGVLKGLHEAGITGSPGDVGDRLRQHPLLRLHQSASHDLRPAQELHRRGSSPLVVGTAQTGYPGKIQRRTGNSPAARHTPGP